MPEKTPVNLQLFKSSGLPTPEKELLLLLMDFVRLAKTRLGLQDKKITVHLLKASPEVPITTAAYEPDTDKISVIIENRHFIDWCRSIAHEMVHQKQKYQNRLDQPIPEIGGKIEDEANAYSGRIVKEFLKKHLSQEQKKLLGLGTY